MKKLILLGIIIFTIAAPMYLSNDPKPQRAYRRLLIATAVAVAVWGALLRFFYFRLE